VETVEYKNISFTVWDVGGQDKVCNFVLYMILFERIKKKRVTVIHLFYFTDPSLVETLLPKYSRSDICCW